MRTIMLIWLNSVFHWTRTTTMMMMTTWTKPITKMSMERLISHSGQFRTIRLIDTIRSILVRKIRAFAIVKSTIDWRNIGMWRHLFGE
jgi:hypothetical protein